MLPMFLTDQKQMLGVGEEAGYKRSRDILAGEACWASRKRYLDTGVWGSREPDLQTDPRESPTSVVLGAEVNVSSSHSLEEV